MKQLLIVLANAVDGREAEFNEWYTYVHVRDVMRSRSAIAVQRFRLAAQQIEGRPLPEHRYLAMYEADDHAGLTEGHAEVFTPAMPISNAFRFDDMREAYYEPLAAIKGRSGVEGDGPVIVERIARSGAPADFERWYVDHRLPERARLPGISSGRFAVVAEHQMLPPADDAHWMAVYRVDDLQAALAAWAAADAGAAPPWQSGSGIVAVYEPVMPRLTPHDCRHPDEATARRAAAAREALGDRIFTGFPAAVPGLPLQVD